MQLQLLQQAIKQEQDSLAEEHRRQIQERAEADEASKVAYYLGTSAHREARLQQVRVAWAARHDWQHDAACSVCHAAGCNHARAAPTVRCPGLPAHPQRQQEADLLRSLRAEEARARTAHNRSRAEAASQQDLAKREELARKLQVRAHATD